MTNKSKKGGVDQLELPFGPSTSEIKNASKFENKIINFSCHMQCKMDKKKLKTRKDKTSKLIDYAESLDW